MEQILRQLVEDGEKVAIVKFNDEGDIELMGNKDIVNILETQKEAIEIKANIAGAKGMGNEFVKLEEEEEEHIVLPKAPVMIRGKGWSQNVPINYLRLLLKALRKEKKVHAKMYGKGRKPRWYPKDMNWEQFKPGTNRQTKEDTTKVVESILTAFGYTSAMHYDGWEEDRRIARERRDEEDQLERERERAEREREAEQERERVEEQEVEQERERVERWEEVQRERVAEQEREETERRWEEAQIEPNNGDEEDDLSYISDDGEEEFQGENYEGYEEEEYTQDQLNNTEVNFGPPSSGESISAAAAETDAESPAAAESRGPNRPKRPTTGACLNCDGRTGEVRMVDGLGPLCWDCRQDQAASLSRCRAGMPREKSSSE
jgi:hypothetical protein